MDAEAVKEQVVDREDKQPSMDLDFVFGRVVHPEIEPDDLPMAVHPIDRPPFYELIL